MKLFDIGLLLNLSLQSVEIVDGHVVKCLRARMQEEVRVLVCVVEVDGDISRFSKMLFTSPMVVCWTSCQSRLSGRSNGLCWWPTWSRMVELLMPITL